MPLQIFAVNLIVIIMFMTIVWLIAKQRRRLDTVDTVWGMGFIVAALATLLQQPNVRSGIVLALVTLWGGRLSLHLAKRSAGRDEDPRYDALSKKWKGNFWVRAYLSIFLTQGLLIWLISAPIVFAANQTVVNGPVLLIVGVMLWIVGYVFEVVGDRQLRDFIAAKKGKVMDQGLWRFSRHPNYFGEISQWFGIAIIASAASWGWLGFIGPVILAYVIIFISGIAMTEKKHAKDPDWRAYQKRTSVLIPLPPRS